MIPAHLAGWGIIMDKELRSDPLKWADSVEPQLFSFNFLVLETVSRSVRRDLISKPPKSHLDAIPSETIVFTAIQDGQHIRHAGKKLSRKTPIHVCFQSVTKSDWEEPVSVWLLKHFTKGFFIRMEIKLDDEIFNSLQFLNNDTDIGLKLFANLAVGAKSSFPDNQENVPFFGNEFDAPNTFHGAKVLGLTDGELYNLWTHKRLETGK